MEDKALKTIIIVWLLIMCSMDYFALPTWQSRLLLWGMNGLFFIVWITKNISRKRGFIPFQERGLLIVLYLFLFWACVSIFFSQDPAIGVKRMGHLLIALLDSYIFYDFFARSEENVQFFRKVITFFVIFVSCWSTLESFQKLSRGEKLFKNIYAGFCNPNFLGHFLFLFFPLILSYYGINSHFQGRYRVWRFLLIILAGYALILASARSSWNGFIFALFFLLFRKNKALGVGILLLAIIVNLSTFVLIGGRIYQTTWQKVYEDRPVWDEYWEAAVENPLFGIGWGVNPPNMIHGHNVYLSNAVQMGVFSAFLVLAFYILILYSALQTEKRIKDPQLKAILLGTTATFCGHIVYNLTESSGVLVYFTANSMSFFPYILLAVPLAINYLCRQQNL
ncbi:MAG: hypothetical protein AB1611_19710 [bacterium]